MLFITNKPPLTAMGDVLHDHDLAEAIVDRVLEPCVYQSTHIRMGVTSVPIDNRLCGENENCAPTPRASIDDMGGRRLAVVIIAPPIYTMAIKVAFDGLGALLVIEDGDHQISVCRCRLPPVRCYRKLSGQVSTTLRRYAHHRTRVYPP